MSTTCELYFTFDLKPDTPPDVLEAIRCMVNKDYLPVSTPAAKYEEEGWKGILDRSGIQMMSFPGDALSSFHKAYRYNLPATKGGAEVYRDTSIFRYETKSESLWGDYIRVLMWIAEYSETQGFIGYLRSEYDTSYPTLLFFKDGKLDIQDTYPRKADG